MSRSRAAAAVKWSLIALMLVQQQRQSGAAVVESADRAVGSRGPCSPADSAGACLFKGLLKSALMYASRRNVSAVRGDGRPQRAKGIERYLAEQIRTLLEVGLFSFGFELPDDVAAPWSLFKSSFLDGRGKKNKNIGPMLAAGAAMMAGTLMPIAFGALFMLAGKAIMTSLVAITISGLLGLKALFGKHESSGHVKAYSAAVPLPHYSEPQFEQDPGVYRTQADAKTRKSAASLSSYYEGERQGTGSDQPEYFAGPKFDGEHDNRRRGEHDGIAPRKDD